MRPRAALSALALALALASPAAAQDPGAGATAEIVGDWTFETEVYDFVCQMTGELTLEESSEPDVYQGRLVARESCVGGGKYEAVQTAVARREGDRLVIESTIVSVSPSPAAYWPDNFALTIVDGALMVGELRSADTAPATFRRSEALIG